VSGAGQEHFALTLHADVARPAFHSGSFGLKEIKMRALLLLLVCVFNVAYAGEFTAKIIVVIDGDTVVIRDTKGLIKIRLADIDAPEKDQTFGMASKQSLSDMVLGKRVQVNSRAVDKYGRMVASLSVNGLDVNTEQIRRGMAWEYSNYHSNKALIALQEEARNASLGLWAESNPTPPWVWRKQHPSTWPGAIPSGTSRKTQTSSDPSCGNKKYCSEMASCEEAMHYFTTCHLKELDGNRNGIPCDNLCAVKVQK